MAALKGNFIGVFYGRSEHRKSLLPTTETNNRFFPSFGTRAVSISPMPLRSGASLRLTSLDFHKEATLLRTFSFISNRPISNNFSDPSSVEDHHARNDGPKAQD